MAALDLTGYKLAFDDEFNTLSVSQTGAGTTWADIRPDSRLDANSDIGFGNSSFLDAASGYNPFSVQDGVLSITAEPHNPTQYGYPGSWASGLLTSQGNFSQEYGYFEIRANFSDLPGAWDAFWLEPDQQTPDPNHAGRWQELDAVEHYGDNPTGVYSTIHTTDVAPSGTWQDNFQVYSQTSQAGGYHTYGVDWEPDTITFYVDGQAVGSKPTPSDMHSPMYFMANLATQNSQNPADAPITSSIDYIRAYASPNTIPGVNNLADQAGASTPSAPTDPAVTPPTVAAGSDQVAGTVVPPATDTGTPTTVPATGDPSAGTVVPPAATTGTDTPSTVTAGADQVPGIVPPATPAGTDAGATGHAAADGGTPTTVAAAGDAGPSADTPAVTDASLPTTVHHHAFGLSAGLAQADAACNNATPLVEGGSWGTPAHNNQVAHLGMFTADIQTVLNEIHGTLANPNNDAATDTAVLQHVEGQLQTLLSEVPQSFGNSNHAFTAQELIHANQASILNVISNDSALAALAETSSTIAPDWNDSHQDAGNGTMPVAPAWHGGMSNEIPAQQGNTNAVNDALGAWGGDIHAASAGEIANLAHNLRFDHIWHSA